MPVSTNTLPASTWGDAVPVSAIAWPPEIGMTGRDGAGYCRRRDWLAGDEQAIEMVDLRCGLNEVNVTVSRSTLRRIPARQR